MLVCIMFCSVLIFFNQWLKNETSSLIMARVVWHICTENMLSWCLPNNRWDRPSEDNEQSYEDIYRDVRTSLSPLHCQQPPGSHFPQTLGCLYNEINQEYDENPTNKKEERTMTKPLLFQQQTGEVNEEYDILEKENYRSTVM